MYEKKFLVIGTFLILAIASCTLPNSADLHPEIVATWDDFNDSGELQYSYIFDDSNHCQKIDWRFYGDGDYSYGTYKINRSQLFIDFTDSPVVEWWNYEIVDDILYLENLTDDLFNIDPVWLETESYKRRS